MYGLLKQNGKSSYGVNDYYVDSEADISTLPKPPNCMPGSTCFVRNEVKIYMLGNDNEWKEI